MNEHPKFKDIKINIEMPYTKNIYPAGKTAEQLSRDEETNSILDSMTYPIIVKPRNGTNHNLVVVKDKATLFQLLKSDQSYHFLLEDTIIV